MYDHFFNKKVVDKLNLKGYKVSSTSTVSARRLRGNFHTPSMDSKL